MQLSIVVDNGIRQSCIKSARRGLMRGTSAGGTTRGRRTTMAMRKSDPAPRPPIAGQVLGPPSPPPAPPSVVPAGRRPPGCTRPRGVVLVVAVAELCVTFGQLQVGYAIHMLVFAVC